MNDFFLDHAEFERRLKLLHRNQLIRAYVIMFTGTLLLIASLFGYVSHRRILNVIRLREVSGSRTYGMVDRVVLDTGDKVY